MVKLITLNIEGEKHLARVMPFLKHKRPDVICLQEVFETDQDLFMDELDMTGQYVPMAQISPDNTLNIAPRGTKGLLIMTRHNFSRTFVHHYHGDSTRLPVLLDDPTAVNRMLLGGELKHRDISYRFITTHFTWTPDGSQSAHQVEDLREMFKLLEPYDHYVLCGDFNAPRGRATYQAITGRLVDHLPGQIRSTIDPELHRIRGLELVVDTVFSTDHYDVSHVTVQDGVSDHMTVSANVVRIRA